MIIVANWKMNPKTLKEAEKLFVSIGRGIKIRRKKRKKLPEIVICPPSVYLFNLKKELSSLRSLTPFLKAGAQDVFWEEEGAYTGEISPLMLKDVGCKYVIIGHSERRRYFGETDEMINKKVKAALKAGLYPILCVGETEKERKKGNIGDILRKQIKSALKGISGSELQTLRFSIAYEPVWAIGSGKACEAGEVRKVKLIIKKVLSSLYSLDV